jgi:uncharacterized lipoprotein YbaY
MEEKLHQACFAYELGLDRAELSVVMNDISPADAPAVSVSGMQLF